MADKGLQPVPIESLVVTDKCIGRYAGGSRYKMTPEMKIVAERIVLKARELIHPAFVFAIHDTGKLDRDHREIFLFSRNQKADPTDFQYIFICICTLGPELENEVKQLSGSGQAIDAMFLDAAGVAYLESLAGHALKFCHDEARKRSFFPGCRLGPGFKDIDLTVQKRLFNLVDTSAIEVRLKSSCVMEPAKSISFWVPWSNKPQISGTGSGYKCGSCELKDCLYRVGGKK